MLYIIVNIFFYLWNIFIGGKSIFWLCLWAPKIVLPRSQNYSNPWLHSNKKKPSVNWRLWYGKQWTNNYYMYNEQVWSEYCETKWVPTIDIYSICTQIVVIEHECVKDRKCERVKKTNWRASQRTTLTGRYGVFDWPTRPAVH